MKHIDYQLNAGGDMCSLGGIVESMRLMRQKPLKHFPFAIMNINKKNRDVKIGLVSENGRPFTYDSFRKWHGRRGLQMVQLTYRVNCGYGHYMLLIIDDGVMYLFNSSPKYADQVQLKCTLKKIAPKLDVDYRGNIFWALGWIWRRQLQIQDTCSIWIALVYYKIAAEQNAVHPNWKKTLKIFLSKPLKEQRRELHEFHRKHLYSKSFSVPLEPKTSMFSCFG